MNTQISNGTRIRIALPVHLRTLARIDGDVEVIVEGIPTISATLDALEMTYPMLRGTIRDHDGQRRRAFMRFYADGLDLSFEPLDSALPPTVVSGQESFCVVGAIAGG